MSVEIAWKQNILVTAFHLLKSLLVVFGFGSQAFVCGFSRQNINSVSRTYIKAKTRALWPGLSTTMNLKLEEQFQSQIQMEILHGKFCVTSNFVHSVFLNHGHKNNANDHKQLCYHKARCFHRRSITSVTIPA